MKTLFLLRHAEAVQESKSGKDFDRPLSKQGLKDASLMGDKIAYSKKFPELIIASASLRTLMTAELVAEKINYAKDKFILSHELYLIEPDDLLNFIRSLDDSYRSIMIVGHNPGLSVACNDLTSAEIRTMPTSACAQISFDNTKWQSIENGSGRLVSFDCP